MNRLTIRARLTLVFGGSFFVAGGVLLAVNYALVAGRLQQNRLSLWIGGSGDTSGLDTAAIGAMVGDYQRVVRDGALDSLLTQGGLALVVVSVVAVAIGWLVAGRALQPLQEITGTARRIAGADGAGRGLHERIALGGPKDEVRELAATFNEMLERLNRAFDGQRRFVANASHELRTPLALNRALVELAMTRPGAPAEVRQLGESLLTVNERHERLIDGLLTLADSENEVTDRTPVDLAEVARHVADQVAGPADVRVELDLAAAPTAGDPVLLERLTQNLVENAVRHNVPEDGWLSAETAVVDGRATLTVSNSGPTVPGYEVESLFQPFRRLNRDRIGGGRGFGLGLSIVRAIARAHNGSVEATPRPQGGLSVTVSLPSRSA
ncbi:sensor histidine kinase [Polymorphospora lycopeni]|uniref:histidine kinase n=1 Tax=Polymorphospora lycopeni TaxID=3140240 RepID=A0ABV5CR02_9ACTN